MASQNVGMSRNPRAMACAEQDIRLEMELTDEALGSCYDDDLWDDWYDDDWPEYRYGRPREPLDEFEFPELLEPEDELSCYDPCEDRDYTSYLP